MSEHSPTPWHTTDYWIADAIGRLIKVEDECERIVRSVNAHAALVEACERFLKAYETRQAWPTAESVEAARAALALAKGETHA